LETTARILWTLLRRKEQI